MEPICEFGFRNAKIFDEIGNTLVDCVHMNHHLSGYKVAQQKKNVKKNVTK